MKLLSVTLCGLVLVLFAGCSQPCSKLADMVCLAHGSGSAQCAEMKSFSDQAGVTERHYCQTAMSVVGSIDDGKTGGSSGSR